MTIREAQKKLGAIQSALAGIDTEAVIVDFGNICAEQSFIQISGYHAGLEGMKKMAADNNLPLEVWPDYYETGDKVVYTDGGVQVFAIIHHEE